MANLVIGMAASSVSSLPTPGPLDIQATNVEERWTTFRLAWENYTIATEINKKPDPVQVATLLTVIGEDARTVYSTFSWSSEDDAKKIDEVIKKFAEYCQPRKNIPFKRYKFNRRAQEPGESYDQYKTVLRQMAQRCDFGSITQDEIVRDRIVFGIHDARVRERLLRESNLTLSKVDELCRAAESTSEHMKIVGGAVSSAEAINAVSASQEILFTNRKDSTGGTGSTVECWNCGRRHGRKQKENCPAYGKKCFKCGKLHHFASKCRSKASTNSSSEIHGIEISEDRPGEVFGAGKETRKRWLEPAQQVTLRLQSGKYLRFQPDKGAQCNVIPIDLYKKATSDFNMRKVIQQKSTLVAYGGSQVKVLGHVIIPVWRGPRPYRIKCKLVESSAIRPILGRRACLGMGIIRYLDNDELNQPPTAGARVYAIERDPAQVSQPCKLGRPLEQSDLLREFPSLFSNQTGLLEGAYHITLDGGARPVQHSPRRVPVAIREKIRLKLEDLESQGILQRVTTPTKWISSMVEVVKPNGQLRICLDPRDLNKAIQRENYVLPTIEDIATRLHGAKVFPKLDVRNGFWHILLDEESSYLTTFHTPFGRYRWRRMPFGICSAPEVFQRRMHELIEGLTGIEVVADDFLVVGFGKDVAEATADHDKHLLAFLQRCKEKKIVLNAEKLHLRRNKVPFIGHVASSTGLGADPTKVKAVVDMPSPTDRAGVQRLLGMAQYLAKFLPGLADKTKPLLDLTQKDTEWFWGNTQEEALQAVKAAVCSTPILRYYNVNEEVKLQCDASQFGLGAALLQNEQPVAYASRALTPAETRYAQIEKEMLAIVFACEHFEGYVYGRELVHIETDHKPLESIVLKPLNAAPKRLQRMLLRLQKFNLNVKYKEGRQMYLADTLSRAPVSEVHAQGCEELEQVNHHQALPVSNQRWAQLKQASREDAVTDALRAIILKGWPKVKSDLPDCLHPYFEFRDQLTVQDELVFRGQQVVVPKAVRRELMEVIHATHIGMEGCIRRARDTLFWPRMGIELRDLISKCDICLRHRSMPAKEPLIAHEVLPQPWAKLGADLCELDGRQLLVVTDYFSSYIEVARLHSVTSRCIIREFREIFARFGIPEILVTDNGPQFSSTEFKTFAQTWGFAHVTSSPRYPKSNGKAENAVKTVKNLFTKCKESGTSEFLALLDWRNTPTAGMSTSPAQRLFGRRCRTIIPVSQELLKPRYSTEKDRLDILSNKRRKQQYYNR